MPKRRSDGLARPRAARSPLENIKWQDWGSPVSCIRATASNLAHTGFDAEDQIAHGLRRMRGGEFKIRQLIDIVDGAQAR